MRIKLEEFRRRQGQAGVTLIEALVSMGVFGVSFFSLYAGMSMGFSVIGNARENLRATQIMVEKMETIRLYSWDQINTPGFIPADFTESYFPAAAGNNEETPDDGQVVANAEGAGGGNAHSTGVVYTGRVTVGNGPSGLSYSADMRRVSISLTWTSGGRAHNRSMITYVARNGLQNYIY